MEGRLAEHGRPPNPEGVSDIRSRLSKPPWRSEAGEVMVRPKGRGIRVLALMNGSQTSTQSLLKEFGLYDHVERIVAINDSRRRAAPAVGRLTP